MSLTIEEKRKKIEEYYINFKRDCCKCIVRRKGDARCHTEDADIERNYKILVDSGELKEEVESIENKDVALDTSAISPKHLNGYIFDSLVYRYQLAREKQARWEVEMENVSPVNARINMGRDTCRFMEILNEAMLEHD